MQMMAWSALQDNPDGDPCPFTDEQLVVLGLLGDWTSDSPKPGLLRAPHIAAFLDWPLVKVERILTELVTIRAIVVAPAD